MQWLTVMMFIKVHKSLSYAVKFKRVRKNQPELGTAEDKSLNGTDWWGSNSF